MNFALTPGLGQAQNMKRRGVRLANASQAVQAEERSFKMALITKEDAVSQARADLAKRLGVAESEVKEEKTETVDFPDMALGAGVKGEMSGQMLTPGWRIRLKANGEGYEYRASRNGGIRLFNFKGNNYRV